MAKKAEKQNNFSVQTKGTGCYAQDSFKFVPENGIVMEAQRNVGVWTVERDGVGEFIRLPRKRSESTLIVKLPHGRLSLTKDNAVQLTLKFFRKKGQDVGAMILAEAQEAAKAVKRFNKLKL